MLVHAHPPAPGARIKGGDVGGGCQDSTMASAAELEAAVATVNANLAELVQQQVAVKEQEERDQEVKEVKEARVGIS